MTPSNDAQVQESFMASFWTSPYKGGPQTTPNDATSTPKIFRGEA